LEDILEIISSDCDKLILFTAKQEI